MDIGIIVDSARGHGPFPAGSIVFSLDGSRPEGGHPCLDASEAFSFEGAAVATSLATAALLIGLPGPSRRIFLASAGAWSSPAMMFEQMSAIFTSDRLEVVAGCDRDAELIRSVWNAGARTAGTLAELKEGLEVGEA